MTDHSANPAPKPAPRLPPDIGAAPVPLGPHDRLFGTEHLTDDLKGRAVRGGMITASSQGLKFVLQLGSTMVLARLLTKADFGLVAMVTAVTGFVALFKDAGLSMATIQRAQITHEQVSTLFWINVALAAGLTLIVAALAPAIAWLYSEPRLVGVTLAIAGTFLFSGFTAQHLALIRRQMRFRTQAVIELLSMSAGIAAGVTMAAYGLGYWSLVGMAAASPAAGCALVWIASGWRPGLPRRGVGASAMARFGANIMGFDTANYCSRYLDNVLIGWYWGASALGPYTLAYALLLKPIQQFHTPIAAVSMPALSRLQGDPVRFTRSALGLLRMTATLGTPVAAAVGVFAEELVYVVLGAEWEASIPIVRWLSVIGVVQIANNQIGTLFMAQGRTDLLLRFGVINAPLAIAAFGVGLPWGPVGVAAVYAVSGLLIRWPLQIAFLARTGRFTQRQLYGATLPAVIFGIVTVLVGAAVRWEMKIGVISPAQAAGGAALLLAWYTLGYALIAPCRRGVRDVLGLASRFRPAKGGGE